MKRYITATNFNIAAISIWVFIVIACNNPTTSKEVEENIVIWKDPVRPVVCYKYNDGGTGTEFDCVVIDAHS